MNETIILTINETTLQPNIVLIDPHEVIVTIIDDECKQLCILCIRLLMTLMC